MPHGMGHMMGHPMGHSVPEHTETERETETETELRDIQANDLNEFSDSNIPDSLVRTSVPEPYRLLLGRDRIRGGPPKPCEAPASYSRQGWKPALDSMTFVTKIVCASDEG